MKNTSRGYTVGRSAFAKISAVEGIRLTKEMERDFRLFEHKGLSAKGRRQEIVKKYAR